MAGKMDELKNIISAANSFSGPMLSSTIPQKVADPLAEAVANPEIFTRNLENVKAQMQDLRDESLAMEHEMENRSRKMVMENVQKKYMPMTITQEVEKAQEINRGNPQVQEILTDYDRTRKAVTDKLGGEFNYGEFELDLKDILSDKNKILKDFRKTALNIPPPAPTGVASYNFKTRPLKPKQKALPQKQKIKAPDSKKPKNYYNEEEHQVKPTPSNPVGNAPKRGGNFSNSSSRRPREETKVTDYPPPGRNIHLEESMEEKKVVEPHTDLLTVKKMVVEDIKNDLENNMTRGKYIDPFQRRDNLENGIDVIETVGLGKPESEESKMRSMDRELHKRDIEGKVAAESEKASKEGQDQVLDAVTDLILREYLKNDIESKEYADMTEEERENHREKEKISSFMASLNKNQMFSDSVDPTIKDLGEEILNEKLEDLFKDLRKGKKNEERNKKSLERKRTIHELMKTSGNQFEKSKKKINFEIDEESWENSSREETKTRKKKSKKNKTMKESFESIDEESNEETPYKKNQIPVGAQFSSGEMGFVNNFGGPVAVGARPGYNQPVYQPAPTQPGFNLGDIQQIVQNTIANEMKKNVNYLEKKNDYPGAMMVQQPEVFETHKIPVNPMSVEEAKLRAEENELK